MVVVSRAPTPTIEPQEVLRPQATPVDTYVRPPDPAPSDLHNLAKGLENFSRDIRGMFQAREARDEEAARIRGEAQFFQDNAVGYAEAVRQGKIPAFASRPFMESYKQAEGKLVGARLASQMQMEYQTWEGRNTQDPANFDTFMADFLKRNLTTQDPDVLKGAMPYIYSTVNAGYTARTQDAADAAYNGGLNANIAVSSMAIDDASTAGLTSGKGTDYDALWDNLIKNRTTALSSGIRSGDYDTKFVDVIAAKAIEERDPALLALLDRTIPGEANPVSATPYGREVKAKTINALETVNYQAENAAYTAQQRRDAALKDELTAFAIDAITADPNVVLPENFWATFSKVEPEARVKVQEWRNAVINGEQEDVEAIRDLNFRVLVGGENAMDVIQQGMNSGVIRQASTLKSLFELGQEKPVWQNAQAYQLGLKAIQNAAGQGNEFGFDPNYVSPAATAASLDFELSMRAWAQTPEGQQAIASNDAATIATVIAQKQKAITDGFTITSGKPATYTQPTEVTEDLEEAGFAPNPQAPTQAQMEEAAAADAAFAASPQGQMPEWTEGTVPDLNTLPPEEQTAIREEADRMGIDPQILLEETYRQVDEIIRGVDQGIDLEQGIQNLIENAPTVQPQSFDGTAKPEDSQFLIDRLVTKGRDSDILDMQAPLVGGIAALIRAAPPEIAAGLGVLSGTRSIERQQALWQDALAKYGSAAEARKWVAPPGNSQHNHGNAADLSFNGRSLRHAPPEVVAWVHENAAQFGLHFPLSNENWHVEPLGTRGTQPFQPQVASNAPRAAEPLLAFISQEEGTAGADPYNTVYGGGTKPITNMTLAEVRRLDTPAAGKYQIQSATLGDAMQALNLSPDEKFSPEVQDEVAMWLLQRRGLGQWLDGRLTDEQFIDNLSMEWAALAGSSGTAFYEGQGQNASLSRLKTALASLR